MHAYRALTYSGKLADQQKLVLDVFLRDPARTWTRQELKEATGLGINAICGRVNEMLQPPFDLLAELDEKKRCSVTGNNVNALALARVPEEGQT